MKRINLNMIFGGDGSYASEITLASGEMMSRREPEIT